MHRLFASILTAGLIALSVWPHPAPKSQQGTASGIELFDQWQQEDPPGTFTTTCSECPPPMVFNLPTPLEWDESLKDIPAKCGGVGGFPALNCLTGQGSPPAHELPDQGNSDCFACRSWYTDPETGFQTDAYVYKVTDCGSCLQTLTDNTSACTAWIDFDNDGEPYPDDDEGEPEPPGTPDEAKDDDGDGILNGHDLWPEGDEGNLEKINKNALLPDWDAQELQTFMDGTFGTESDLIPTSGGPDTPFLEFEDINQDGAKTLDEALVAYIKFGDENQAELKKVAENVQELRDALEDPNHPLNANGQVTADDVKAAQNSLHEKTFAQAQAMSAIHGLGKTTGLLPEDTLNSIKKQLDDFGTAVEEVQFALSFDGNSSSAFTGFNRKSLSDLTEWFMMDQDGAHQYTVSLLDENGVETGPSSHHPESSETNKNAVGDPVDTANGSFYYTTVDLDIPGRGQSLTLRRIYRSRSTRLGFAGRNWSIPLLETYLMFWPAPGSLPYSVSVLWGDGRVSMFPRSTETGTLVLFEGADGELGKIRSLDSLNTGEPDCPKNPYEINYVLRKPDGTEYYFCPPSNYSGVDKFAVCWLRKVTDPYGNAITIQRNGYGEPIRVIDTLGRSVTLTFQDHLLTELKDWAGRTTTYTYDTNKRELLRVDYPNTLHLGANDTVAAARPYEIYTYWEQPTGYDDLPERVFNHNLTSITSDTSKGPRVVVDYYTSGYERDRVSLLTVDGTFTSFSYMPLTSTGNDLGAFPTPNDSRVVHMTETTSGEGEVARYYHGNSVLYRKDLLNGRFAGSTVIPGSTDGTSVQAWMEIYDYNDDFLMTEHLRTTDQNYPAGRRTVHTYDEANSDRFQQGNLLTIVEYPDPAGNAPTPNRTTTFTYDPVTARPIATADYQGRITTVNYLHQELSYQTLLDHPKINGWGILPQSPTYPPLWGLGDVNQDGQLGGGFRVARKTLPTVTLETSPGSTSTTTATELLSYDAHGELIKKVDSAGVITRLYYSGGQLERIVHDKGGLALETLLYHDVLRRVVTETRPDGMVATFKYDSRGNIIENKEVDPNFVPPPPGSGSPFDPQEALIDQHFFDLEGNHIGSGSSFYGDKRGNYGPGLVAYLDWISTYSAGGRESARQRRLFSDTNTLLDSGDWSHTFDSKGRITQLSIPGGATYDYEHDGRGQVLRFTRNAGGASHTTEYSYDPYGAVVGVLLPVDSDGDGSNDEYEYTYDGYGHQVETLYPSGHKEVHAINADGNVTRTELLQGTTLLAGASYTYDEWNRVTRRTFDNLEFEIDGSVTSGSPPTIEQHTGHHVRPSQVMWNLYNATGAARLTTNTYDSLGRQTARYYGQGTDVGVINTLDPVGRILTSTHRFDGDGRTGNINPSEATWTHKYDKFGFLVSTVDPLGHETKTAYTPRGLPSYRQFASGRKEIFRYNSLGELVKLTEDALNGNIRFERWDYDILGHLKSATDANQNQTTYAYDGLGRRVQRTLTDQSSHTYGYDAIDRMTSSTHSAGSTQSYDYHPLFGVESMTASGLDVPVSRSVLFGPLGMPRSVTEVVGARTVTTERKYSSLGVILEERLSGSVPSSTSSFNYNGVGELTNVLYPSGHSVTRQYDTLGRPTSISSSVHGNIVSNLTPYGLSRFRIASLGDGSTLENEYTPVGRHQRSETLWGTTPILGFINQFDSEGNLLSRTSSRTGVLEEFDYDGFNRLTDWEFDVGSGASALQAWSYDLADNLTQLSASGVPTIAPTTNPLNQYTSFGGGSSFAYLGQGQEDFRQTSGADLDWQWDALGRPYSCTKTEGATSTTVDFFVDANGRVVGTNTAGGEAIYYRYSGNSVIQRDSSIDGVSDYVYGYGSDLVFLSRGVNGHFLAQDHLGNTLGLHSGGSVQASFRYDPYGVVRDELSGTPTGPVHGFDAFFTGQPFESTTGMHILGARMYDPDLGRFLSRDPLEEPAGLNLYSYARSNPLRFLDPRGLEPGEKETSTPPSHDAGQLNSNGVIVGTPIEVMNAWIDRHAEANGIELSADTYEGLTSEEQAMIADFAANSAADKLIAYEEHGGKKSSAVFQRENDIPTAKQADLLKKGYAELTSKLIDVSFVNFTSQVISVSEEIGFLLLRAPDLAVGTTLDMLGAPNNGAIRGVILVAATGGVGAGRSIGKGIAAGASALWKAATRRKAISAAANQGRRAAFREAKRHNNVPVSQQPDRVLRPGTPEGNAAGLRGGQNARLYEFTNSNGKKVHIREDFPVRYRDGGFQPGHFNSGPKLQKLRGHHYFQ